MNHTHQEQPSLLLSVYIYHAKSSARSSMKLIVFFGGYTKSVCHQWLILRFFSLSGSETLHLLCHSWAYPLCFSYRLRHFSICQLYLWSIFIPLAVTLRLFSSSGDHPAAPRVLWMIQSLCFGSYNQSIMASLPSNPLPSHDHRWWLNTYPKMHFSIFV